MDRTKTTFNMFSIHYTAKKKHLPSNLKFYKIKKIMLQKARKQNNRKIYNHILTNLQTSQTKNLWTLLKEMIVL